MDIDDESDHKETSCCGFFWGPYRPIFGGHALFEASTSAIVPVFVVFLYRAAMAIFLMSTLVYYAIKGVYQFQFYSVWCHLGLGFAFAFSTAVTFSFLITPRKYESFRPSALAFLSILLFQIFSTAAFFLDVVYWTLIYNFNSGSGPTFAQLAQHALNFVCVLIDLMLSLRMQFKLTYAMMFVAYTIFYVAFAWVRFAITDDFVYHFLDYRDKSPGITIAYYMGVLFWGLAASIIMILVSRLNRLPCVPGRYSRENLVHLDDEDDDGDDDDDDDDDELDHDGNNGHRNDGRSYV